MKDHSENSLAAAIADGVDISETDYGGSPGLKNLDSIAAAFRGVRDPEITQRDFLFRWRHLEAVEAIGQGGFGTVYRAYDPVLKREVALKLARESKQGSRTRDRLIIAEARRMARLRHSNILAIHGADEEDGRAGIWCDLLEGETLQTLLDRTGPLGTNTILNLASPLTDALSVIHARGITHGDIKPGNVMIQSSGEPVLMDFGAGGGVGTSGPLSGSPLVMAPELFTGGLLCPESDIYSLGVLMYLLFTGRYPVEADSIEGLIKARGNIDFSDIPRVFRSLVTDCLASNPDTRPAAGEISERLRAIKQAPASRRRKLAVSIVIASLSAGLFLSSFGLWRASQSEARAQAEKINAERTLEFLETMLQAPSTLNRGPELKVVDLLDSAARELERAPPDNALEQARLEYILGRTYRTLDRIESARTSLQSALSIYQGKLNDPDTEDLDVLVDLATVEINAGDYDKAQALLNRLSELAAARHGPRSHHALLAQFKMGEMANLTGDTQGAVDIIEAAYAQSEELPEDDFLRAQMQTKLAQAYAFTGQLREAEELIRQSLEWELQYRGGETIDALVKLNALSIILSNASNPAGAEQAILQALSILDSIAPGPSRPRAGLRGNLASAVLYQGRAEEALAMNLETLEMNRQLDNPAGISTMTINISSNYLELGRYEDAIEWAEDAAEQSMEMYGADSQWTLMAQTHLVDSHLEAGNVDWALPRAQAQYPKNQRVLGDRNLTTLVAGDTLGAALIRSGAARDGTALLEEILALKIKTLGDDNHETWDTREHLIEGLLATGNRDRAAEMATKLVEYRSTKLPAGHLKVAQARKLMERSIRAD